MATNLNYVKQEVIDSLNPKQKKDLLHTMERMEKAKEGTRIAYKLFRVLKSGEITPLFINKSKTLQSGTWIEAECHPTKGFAVRPFWHCSINPVAPHLSEKGRIWKKVQIRGYIEYERPEHQGGTWFLAKEIKIID